MTAAQLAKKIAALSPNNRVLVESLIEALASPPAASSRPKSFKNHPSFGAWANRTDLPEDNDTLARELRKKASRRRAD